MLQPAVKINSNAALENNAFNARRVAFGPASNCANARMRYLSVYVR